MTAKIKSEEIEAWLKSPRAVDKYELALAEAIKAAYAEGALQDVLASLPGLRRRARSVVPIGLLEGESAARYLRDLIRTISRHAVRELSSSYSAYRWLFYLRRTPDFLFAGDIDSTAPYTRRLAEVLACSRALPERAFVSPDVIEQGIGLSFPVDIDAGRSVLRLVVYARELHLLHGHLRSNAKGAGIRVASDGSTATVASDEFFAATELFDLRAQENPERSRFGTAFSGYRSGADWPTVVSVGMAFEPFDLPSRIVAPAADLSLPDDVVLTVRYTLHMADLREVSRVMKLESVGAPELWAEDCGPLLCFLTYCTLLLGEQPKSRLNVCRVGYFLQRHDAFESYYDQRAAEIVAEVGAAFPPLKTTLPSSGREFLRVLRRMEGKDLPLLPGPPIFEAGARWLGVDVGTASWRLASVLQLPTTDTGEVGNTRGGQFERGVQALIDDSPWRPKDPPLRSLVNRHLRLAGRAIGEIDSVGQREGVVLLVSCKSRLYTMDYDAGDYRTIRNATSALIEDIGKWLALLATLRAHPKGDNYDLRGHKLEGVLLTPMLLYVPLEHAERLSLPGLRFYSSAPEFEAWLTGTAGYGLAIA